MKKTLTTLSLAVFIALSLSACTINVPIPETEPSSASTPVETSSPEPAEETPEPTPEEVEKVDGYQEIYDTYSARLQNECPELSTMECAELANKGVSKMARYMYSASGKDGQYETYSSWAGKLMDVYMAEAQ